MKVVEVSAISDRFAISPDASCMYMYYPNWKGGWISSDVKNPLSLWNLVTNGRVVHRGIFKIKVVED